MKIRIVCNIIGAFLFLLFPQLAFTQETTSVSSGADFTIPQLDFEAAAVETPNIPKEEFFRAEIIEIKDQGEVDLGPGYTEEYQELTAEILSGSHQGTLVSLRHSGVRSLDQFFDLVEVGDQVVLIKIYDTAGGFEYYINDQYRITPILVIFLFFIGLALYFGRLKGLTSLLGLMVSVGVLAFFIVPRIVAGDDPIIITLVGSLLIAVVSLFLAHGFNRRTAIAVGSTVITLVLATGMALLSVNGAKLLGLGSEEAFYLQVGNLSFIDLKGLLLAGIIIGTLGVLDDITTAQTAVVGELKRANPELSRNELYKRGVIVGKEHIVSLVNTLVLAYAGASLPLFLLFNSNRSLPLWVLVNGELVAEELIRTLVGSAALILAVPIATWLAAKFLSEKDTEQMQTHGHVH